MNQPKNDPKVVKLDNFRLVVPPYPMPMHGHMKAATWEQFLEMKLWERGK
jgi:hypothetical protein